MKNLLLLAMLLCGLGTISHGQTTYTTDSAHAMLQPDSNTLYIDGSGKTLTQLQFILAVKSGKYSFAPKVENGRIKSVQLVKQAEAVTMGKTAVDFSVTDLQGHQYSLHDLKGKIVVLNFWFTACAPCRQEMPELNGLVDKYKDDRNVVFLAITYDPAQRVKDFLSHQAFAFNIVTDQQAMINAYGVTNYPTSLVIDKTGEIAFSLTAYDGTNVAQLDGVIAALQKQH